MCGQRKLYQSEILIVVFCTMVKGATFPGGETLRKLFCVRVSVFSHLVLQDRAECA